MSVPPSRAGNLRGPRGRLLLEVLGQEPLQQRGHLGGPLQLGGVTGARSRLTLTGRTREDHFGAVLLSRSRYYAPATHSTRFYREYFRPAAERIVEKDRRRWLVAYRGVEFYLHLDRLTNPAHDGYFIEVKSRTWSQRDARDKAAVITDLLALFGTRPDDTLSDGYADLATSA